MAKISLAALGVLVEPLGEARELIQDASGFLARRRFPADRVASISQVEFEEAATLVLLLREVSELGC